MRQPYSNPYPKPPQDPVNERASRISEEKFRKAHFSKEIREAQPLQVRSSPYCTCATIAMLVEVV